jgi:hypothetical protein
LREEQRRQPGCPARQVVQVFRTRDTSCGGGMGAVIQTEFYRGSWPLSRRYSLSAGTQPGWCFS